MEVPGKLYVLYREEGAGFAVCDGRCPKAYRVLDAMSGEEVGRGEIRADVGATNAQRVELDGKGPRVVVFEG